MEFALSIKKITFAESSVGNGILMLLQKEGDNVKRERLKLLLCAESLDHLKYQGYKRKRSRLCYISVCLYELDGLYIIWRGAIVYYWY